MITVYLSAKPMGGCKLSVHLFSLLFVPRPSAPFSARDPPPRARRRRRILLAAETTPNRMACGPRISAESHETRHIYGAAMCRPPPTYRTASSMHDQTDSDAERDTGGPSWSGQGSRERGGHGSYDVPLLTRAFEWPSPEEDGSSGRFQPRLSTWVDPPQGKRINGMTGEEVILIWTQSKMIRGFFGRRSTWIRSTDDTALRRCTGGTTGGDGCRLGNQRGL